MEKLNQFTTGRSSGASHTEAAGIGSRTLSFSYSWELAPFSNIRKDDALNIFKLETHSAQQPPASR